MRTSAQVLHDEVLARWRRLPPHKFFKSDKLKVVRTRDWRLGRALAAAGVEYG